MCIRDSINSMQRTDLKLNKIITSLEFDSDELGYSRYFQIYQGSLFKKVEGGERDWRLVIPEGLVDKIIWDCHSRYGHFGARKCVNVLKESCLFNCSFTEPITCSLNVLKHSFVSFKRLLILSFISYKRLSLIHI